MMIMRLLASVAALCAATTAAADGLYYGGGLSIVDGKSESGFAETNSEDTYGAIGGTVGYRWDQSAVFFGAELDLDIPFGSDFRDSGTACSDFATGPYYCEHTVTSRLRAIVGAPIGKFEGFGSIGCASMGGQAANDPTSVAEAVNSGYTLGVGIQQDFRGNTLRYEVIYDNMEENVTSQGGGYEPTFEAVSFKVSYLFN